MRSPVGLLTPTIYGCSTVRLARKPKTKHEIMLQGLEEVNVGLQRTAQGVVRDGRTWGDELQFG